MLYSNKIIPLKNNKKITLGELLEGATTMTELVLAWEDRLISILCAKQVDWLKKSWDHLDWTAEHQTAALELLQAARRMKKIRASMQAERRRILHNNQEPT